MANPNVVGSAQAQMTLDFLLNIFLVVVAIVLACVVLAFAFIVLVYYQSPDDVDQTWGSKYVAIFALWLVIYMPVFSAIDFAGVSTGCEAASDFDLDMMAFTRRDRVCTAPTKTMLYILMYLCIAMTYFVIPFTLVLQIDSLSKWVPLQEPMLPSAHPPLHFSPPYPSIPSIAAPAFHFSPLIKGVVQD